MGQFQIPLLNDDFKIIIDCHISTTIPDENGYYSLFAVRALIDTGASTSAITQRILTNIRPSLNPRTGVINYGGGPQILNASTYNVIIHLPSQDRRQCIAIPMDNREGLDIIIGMDILKGGNFEFLKQENGSHICIFTF